LGSKFHEFEGSLGNSKVSKQKYSKIKQNKTKTPQYHQKKKKSTKRKELAIPTVEAQKRGSQLKASWGKKSVRSYLKNKM
jgi:hypothetical protein